MFRKVLHPSQWLYPVSLPSSRACLISSRSVMISCKCSKRTTFWYAVFRYISLPFFQTNQPVFPPPNQQPPPASTASSGPSASSPNPPQPPTAGGETLSPELFTGIVQGVLSTMMGSLGAGQGNSESIAQFIQRLSQTSNLFTPGAGDAVGKRLC